MCVFLHIELASPWDLDLTLRAEKAVLWYVLWSLSWGRAGDAKRPDSVTRAESFCNHVSQKRPNFRPPSSLAGESWQRWGCRWDWSDQETADHHLWQVEHNWGKQTTLNCSQVQIRHGKLTGGGRVDNWGPEKVRNDPNTGWWTLEGGGMMLVKDSQTLRLCWEPREERCRWKGAKVALEDFFLPGGRTDFGAGGRVDEARQGKRLCFHDREAWKAGGACQVETKKAMISYI